MIYLAIKEGAGDLCGERIEAKPKEVVVSGKGVRHDPARIDALTSLPELTSSQELQQFICALNWMRTALPIFNKLTAPL
ncbi:hypothetical protein PHMEG_00025550 [Phytophthora megakarya]|uniref:Uncharacterized protein n=1 Tax=Phytophthora megakarya TaxID=4795 RepID=A0A225VBW9_9STRA|nr:hypothetical protein PHMEG_00025550 [Phytophthora megakarya]